jgi:esterase/lipase
MWSLRDSCCRGGEHLARIHEPALVIQSDADTGVFPSDAHTIYDGLAAKDKTLSMISGDHYLQDPADARTVAAELISEWLKERL